MVEASEIVLAELTTGNGNVTYELGWAHALGESVILAAQTMAGVPSDLRHLRVILYDKNDPAWGQKLAQRITRAITEALATERLPTA